MNHPDRPYCAGCGRQGRALHGDGCPHGQPVQVTIAFRLRPSVALGGDQLREYLTALAMGVPGEVAEPVSVGVRVIGAAGESSVIEGAGP